MAPRLDPARLQAQEGPVLNRELWEALAERSDSTASTGVGPRPCGASAERIANELATRAAADQTASVLSSSRDSAHGSKSTCEESDEARPDPFPDRRVRFVQPARYRLPRAASE